MLFALLFGAASVLTRVQNDDDCANLRLEPSCQRNAHSYAEPTYRHTDLFSL